MSVAEGDRFHLWGGVFQPIFNAIMNSSWGQFVKRFLRVGWD